MDKKLVNRLIENLKVRSVGEREVFLWGGTVYLAGLLQLCWANAPLCCEIPKRLPHTYIAEAFGSGHILGGPNCSAGGVQNNVQDCPIFILLKSELTL